MQIGSSSASVFIKSSAGGDASSQRIQKAIDTARSGSPFAMQLKQSASSHSPGGMRPETPPVSWGDVMFNLGATDGAIHIEDVVKVADAAMKDAKEQLDFAFASAGIRNTPPVHFSFDLNSQLTVGDHPQKEQIQKLLSENEGLARNVSTAMILKQNAVSWQKAANFTDAYQRIYQQKGPDAALALMERFMAIGNPKSSFRYGDDGFAGLFDGKPEQAYLASVMHSLGLGSGSRVDAFA